MKKKDKKLYFLKERTKTAMTIESDIKRSGLLGGPDPKCSSAWVEELSLRNKDDKTKTGHCCVLPPAEESYTHRTGTSIWNTMMAFSHSLTS